MQHSWLTPNAELREAGAKGRGVFATADIPAGTSVSVFGGYVCDLEEFHQLDEHRQTHSIQIDDGLFMVCAEGEEPADFLNHSCDPNLGIVGNVLLVTMRAVAAATSRPTWTVGSRRSAERGRAGQTGQRSASSG